MSFGWLDYDLSLEHITESVKNIIVYIYHNNDASALPILADALEEAGFNSKSALQHLRFDSHPDFCFCVTVDAIMSFIQLHKLI